MEVATIRNTWEENTALGRAMRESFAMVSMDDLHNTHNRILVSGWCMATVALVAQKLTEIGVKASQVYIDRDGVALVRMRRFPRHTAEKIVEALRGMDVEAIRV